MHINTDDIFLYSKYEQAWFVATSRFCFWAWIWPTGHSTWVVSGLLIALLEKLNVFRLTGLTTLVLLMLKWMGLFLSKNNLFRCWDSCFLNCFLNWIGALTLSLLLKSAFEENWALIRSMKFPSPEVALYFYKSIIQLRISMSALVLLPATWIC